MRSFGFSRPSHPGHSQETYSAFGPVKESKKMASASILAEAFTDWFSSKGASFDSQCPLSIDARTKAIFFSYNWCGSCQPLVAYVLGSHSSKSKTG